MKNLIEETSLNTHKLVQYVDHQGFTERSPIYEIHENDIIATQLPHQGKLLMSMVTHKKGNFWFNEHNTFLVDHHTQENYIIKREVTSNFSLLEFTGLTFIELDDYQDIMQGDLIAVEEHGILSLGYAHEKHGEHWWHNNNLKNGAEHVAGITSNNIYRIVL